MSNRPRVINANEVIPATRKSPATQMIEALGGEYKTSRDVAEYFGVHVETIRRLTKARNKDGTKKINAPSKATVAGEMVIYLFTEEDVAELEEYFGRKMNPPQENDGDSEEQALPSP